MAEHKRYRLLSGRHSHVWTDKKGQRHRTPLRAGAIFRPTKNERAILGDRIEPYDGDEAGVGESGRAKQASDGSAAQIEPAQYSGLSVQELRDEVDRRVAAGRDVKPSTRATRRGLIDALTVDDEVNGELVEQGEGEAEQNQPDSSPEAFFGEGQE